MSLPTGVSSDRSFLDMHNVFMLILTTELGNPSIVGQSTWTLGLEVMLNTWITFIVQSESRPVALRILHSSGMA